MSLQISFFFHRLCSLLLGICEESCNYGRKEVEGVSLATKKLENGHDVWWIPDVTKLPIAKLNDLKIPLVSTVICMYMHERMRIRNKRKPKKSGRLNSDNPVSQ